MSPAPSGPLPSEHLGLLLVSGGRPVFHPQDRRDLSWPQGSLKATSSYTGPPVCSALTALNSVGVAGRCPLDSARSPTASGRPAGHTWFPRPSCPLSVSESLSVSPSLGLEGVTLPGRYEPTCQAELGPPLLQGAHSRCSIISANGRKCGVSSARARAREGNRDPDGASRSGPGWGWMGLGAGACPTLRGQEGWTGLAFRAPISPASALGCSPCSFTENKVWLLTPLLVRCHHPPGEAAGSDRSLGALGGAPASPCSCSPPIACSRQALP